MPGVREIAPLAAQPNPACCRLSSQQTTTGIVVSNAQDPRAGDTTGVEYEPTTDRERRPDWDDGLHTRPEGARTEYRAFTGKGGPVLLDVRPPPPRPAGTRAEGLPRADGPGAGSGRPGRVTERGRRPGRDFPRTGSGTDRAGRLAPGDEAEADQGPRCLSRRGDPGGLRGPRRFRGPGRACRLGDGRSARRSIGRTRPGSRRPARAVESRIQAYWGDSPGAAGRARGRALAGAAPASRRRTRRRRRPPAAPRSACAMLTSGARWARPGGFTGTAVQESPVAPPRRPRRPGRGFPRRGPGGPPGGPRDARSRGPARPARPAAPGRRRAATRRAGRRVRPPPRTGPCRRATGRPGGGPRRRRGRHPLRAVPEVGAVEGGHGGGREAGVDGRQGEARRKTSSPRAGRPCRGVGNSGRRGGIRRRPAGRRSAEVGRERGGRVHVA